MRVADVLFFPSSAPSHTNQLLLELTKGTRDYFYYNTCVALASRDLQRARDLLSQWSESPHQRDQAFAELRNQLAVRQYEQDQDGLALAQTLGISVPNVEQIAVDPSLRKTAVILLLPICKKANTVSARNSIKTQSIQSYMISKLNSII